MKKFLIAGNWKMNKSIAEAKLFADQLKGERIVHPEQLAVIAPFTQLETLKRELDGTGIKVGAQNVHFEKSGAYTGEISVPMLKELDIDLCIVGHSERREYFAETDSTVNMKLKALLNAGITPILCVGESLEIRETGNAMLFVSGQITEDLDGLTPAEVEQIVIAYEPIWAIGTGKPATPDQAEEMCGFIRGMIEGMYGRETAEGMIIQYGGSMKPSNADELLKKPDINGGLIGGASLEVGTFMEIAKAAFKLQ
ncbi:MAG: triose-phosphate isomerase [Mogibacterium diversum]|nr:triose-phosphate isomerase [Mogibacterium diversum]